MAIETIALNQQQQYQQSSLIERDIRLSKITNNPALNELSPRVESSTLLANNSEKRLSQQSRKEFTSTELTSEADAYQRPLPPKIKLIKLILESYLGKNLDLSNKFDYQAAKTQAQQQMDDAQASPVAEFITLAGQQFNAGDNVSVTTLTVEQQKLDYQMQGTFKLDNRIINLDYRLSLSSEYSSITKLETTAAALKDPLIIQFGARGLGSITDFTPLDINNDQQLDALPIFSGDVGYLFFDKNNNKQVDNGSELFGPKTGSGFNELAKLDSNNNGFFDQQDDNYQNIYIWQPQKQAMTSLSAAGISAIYLDAINTPFNFRDQSGEISAQLRQTSFAIGENNQAYGVHQVDVRI
jgi:antitoxin component HigA of HigAB toxin-antitoxin module